MTTLKTAVDQWAIALKAGLPTYKSAYTSAWRSTLNFTDATEKDLYDAACQIKAKVADANIKAKCDAVMAAVTGAVTVNWTNGSSKVAKAKGIAIWYPSSPQQLKGIVNGDFTWYRTNEALATQTNWDEFLAAYCQ